MAGARFFQFYLDNYFNFPKEIKNDIIYCQRAFHAHLKVHQLIVAKVKPEEGFSDYKEKILKELEDEMFLINGEQNFLLLRLRRVIDEFYKSVQRGGVPIDSDLTNQLIFREVGPYIHDTKEEIKPVSVQFYNTEEKLMEKYFAPLYNRINGIEKFDENVKLSSSHSSSTSSTFAERRPQLCSSGGIADGVDVNGGDICVLPHQSFSNSQQSKLDLTPNGAYPARNGNHLSQVSLLKPISQRMVSQLRNNVGTRSLYPEPVNNRVSNLPSSSLYVRKTPYEIPRNSNGPHIAVSIKEEPTINLPVSKNVTLSRLNLQQALKKAKTDTLAAKALTKQPPPPPPIANLIPPTNQQTSETGFCAIVPSAPATLSAKAKNEGKTKVAGKAGIKFPSTTAHASQTRVLRARAISTSSEELSPTERELTPPATYLLRGEEQMPKTKAEEYGQEMFLRIFGLVTPEMQVQLQQRRSKRRRRTVHNNERADFHYGRIECSNQAADDKQKNKAFLLSPQAKRSKKRQRPEGSTDEPPTSRSGSSSPEENRVCNECMKRRGSVDQCDECKGFYHRSCHSPHVIDAKIIASTSRDRQQPLEYTNCCPACSRLQMNQIKKETKHETLSSTVHELKEKMDIEKHRRASLQHTSKLFKTQMRKLFNIVKTIKSDNDIDSSD